MTADGNAEAEAEVDQRIRDMAYARAHGEDAQIGWRRAIFGDVERTDGGDQDSPPR